MTCLWSNAGWWTTLEPSFSASHSLHWGKISASCRLATKTPSDFSKYFMKTLNQHMMCGEKDFRLRFDPALTWFDRCKLFVSAIMLNVPLNAWDCSCCSVVGFATTLKQSCCLFLRRIYKRILWRRSLLTSNLKVQGKIHETVMKPVKWKTCFSFCWFREMLVWYFRSWKHETIARENSENGIMLRWEFHTLFTSNADFVTEVLLITVIN